MREAEAKLMALGFKLLPPKRVLGEKDWVYGIISRGRPLNTGDHVSIDVPLTLIIGNGRYGEDEDIDYVDDYMYPEEHPDDDVDEFQEVDAPSRPSAAEQLGKPDNAYDE